MSATTTLLDQSQPATPASNSADPVILRAVEITKIFPGTLALDKVNFNVYRGKVNALVGENGAGKSTLMKILAGVERPTSGALLLEGEPIAPRSTGEAEAHGIGIIYQELNLCANLSVADNMFLGREIAPNGVIDGKQQSIEARKLIEKLGHDIDPDTLVSELRIGQQQIVEIAKALAQDVRVLIMDEPTSALSATEVAVLARIIDDLKQQGVSIIYISHKLEEITQIGDYVTVLRDGKLVEEARVPDINVPWIIERMVGRDPAALFHKGNATVGEELLRIENLTLPARAGGYAVDHISFSLRKGEVLGIYGLMGAGRSELVETLAGRHPEATGSIFLNGELVTGNTVTERIADGIVLVPEDRQRDGLMQTMTVAENMLIASLQNYLNRWLPFLSGILEKSTAVRMIGELGVRTPSHNQKITALSGGNQQKVVVAKGLLTKPRVLLLDEPSRGIDVAAKSEIFAIMSKLADEGYGVIFISSELKEVLAMSDRILVMSKGAITGDFTRAEASEEKLVNAASVGHGVIQRDAAQATAALNGIALPVQQGSTR